MSDKMLCVGIMTGVIVMCIKVFTLDDVIVVKSSLSHKYVSCDFGLTSFDSVRTI